MSADSAMRRSLLILVEPENGARLESLSHRQPIASTALVFDRLH
jgi:hypothetical protein